jgi:hypothetical protein
MVMSYVEDPTSDARDSPFEIYLKNNLWNIIYLFVKTIEFLD